MSNVSLLKKNLIISKNNLLLHQDVIQAFFNIDFIFSKKLIESENQEILKVNKFVLQFLIKEENLFLKFPLKAKTFSTLNQYNQSILKNFGNNVLVKYKNLILNTRIYNLLNDFSVSNVFKKFQHICESIIFLFILYQCNFSQKKHQKIQTIYTIC